MEKRADWSEQNVEKARALWQDGMSASQVAAEMGPGFTRSAVIGKLRRLGKADRASRNLKPVAARPRKAPAPRQQPIEPLPPEQEIPLPVSRRVALTDLRESMCKWPIDRRDDQWLFCGADKFLDGKPYCAHHAGIARLGSPPKVVSEETREKKRLAALRNGSHQFAKARA